MRLQPVTTKASNSEAMQGQHCGQETHSFSKVGRWRSLKEIHIADQKVEQR